jgi:hypothetical protein
VTPNELIRDLTVRGIVLSADGDRLNVDGLDSALTDEVLETIRARKAELLELLAIELCPVCSTELAETAGKRFRHLWCPNMPWHFDSWRALGGLGLKEAGAPIVDFYDGRQIEIPQASTPEGWEPPF